MRRSRTSLDKAALLAWCKEMTAGHDNVDVKNFSSSWNDGLAFCALMHKFFPAEVPFSSLEGGTAEGRAYNCELAFRVAEKCAGVQPLFDAEDMAATYPKPDEKSVITYVALLINALDREAATAIPRSDEPQTPRTPAMARTAAQRAAAKKAAAAAEEAATSAAGAEEAQTAEAKTCASCGFKVAPEDKFCMSCGSAQVTVPTTLPQGAATEEATQATDEAPPAPAPSAEPVAPMMRTATSSDVVQAAPSDGGPSPPPPSSSPPAAEEGGAAPTDMHAGAAAAAAVMLQQGDEAKPPPPPPGRRTLPPGAPPPPWALKLPPPKIDAGEEGAAAEEGDGAQQSEPQKLLTATSWLDNLQAALTPRRTSSLPSEATKSRPPRRTERGAAARVGKLQEAVEGLSTRQEEEEEQEEEEGSRAEPQKLVHAGSWIDDMLSPLTSARRTSALPSESTKSRPPRRTERGAAARVGKLQETVEGLSTRQEEEEEQDDEEEGGRAAPQKLVHATSWIDNMLAPLTPRRNSALPSESTKSRPPRRTERGGAARMGRLQQTVGGLSTRQEEEELEEQDEEQGGEPTRELVQRLRRELAAERNGRAQAEARAAAAEKLLQQIGRAALQGNWDGVEPEPEPARAAAADARAAPVASGAPAEPEPLAMQVRRRNSGLLGSGGP